LQALVEAQLRLRRPRIAEMPTQSLERLLAQSAMSNELSAETGRRRLAESHLKPWRKDMWRIPKVDGEYVARIR
jgi:hypothetical protein